MFILLLEACKEMLQNWYIHVFIWTVVLDIITGLAKVLSSKNKKTDSTKGLIGLIKHLLVVILVTVAYPYLYVVGLKEVATTFVVFYIAMYAISIIENFGQLGIPFPDFVTERFKKLKDTTNKGE